MSLLCPHHPQREADPVVCTLCAGRLRRDLRDLLALWPALRPLLTSRGNGGTTRGKRTPAPVRLDVLDLLDARGAVQSTLVSWARLVVEERNLSRTPDSIGGCLTLLWRHDAWLLEHPAADEACTEIHDCAHAVRLACGEAPEPPLGKCPDVDPSGETERCNGPLRMVDGDATVVCARCGGRWLADDLVNVGRVSPLNLWETVPHVAAMLDMSERTLRHWVTVGKVRRNSLGQVRHADAWKVRHDGA